MLVDVPLVSARPDIVAWLVHEYYGGKALGTSSRMVCKHPFL